MALPDFQSFFYPTFLMIKDKKEYSIDELRNFLTTYFKLTEDDKSEKVPSGTQTKFNNRIYWTKSYFTKANLIESTKRSHFKITKKGVEFFNKLENNKKITIKDLENIPEFHSFKYGDSLNQLSIEENLIEDKTPFERLEDIHQDLIVKMGYGGAKSRKGNSVKRTNDEGIDGIINEDKLGLELIYLQAKKWDTETTIGRPEVQKFVGALHGQRAKKGVFITTSKFSDNAYEYVKTIDPKVVLIDGKTLTKLMIEYEIGTTVVENYQVKKIDTDYFEK